MIVKHYLHDDYELSEIEEELEERLGDMPDNIKEKIALQIYNFCYEVELKFEFDRHSGDLIKVEVK
jgi:predicted DNA-binding protein YlxM (UPF0122 family)